MTTAVKQTHNRLVGIGTIVSWLVVVSLGFLSFEAQALPVFARQTGQNCVACHAGGQFPELTPYGRKFKMTGYTIGARTLPFSVMGVVNYANVENTSKSDSPTDDFQKDNLPVLASGSLFIAGKVTDNIGLFSQITYDNYAKRSDDGKYHGHSSADNIDLRYADRFVDDNSDLIVGVSANDNPSVTDPWNTAAAWMQYVPAASVTSQQFADANTPYPGNSTGSNVAGVSAYAYWNSMVYAELGTYRTADQLFSVMSAGVGDADMTKLEGSNNPYLRLALTRDWGPHSIMVGTAGMVAHIYDDPTDTSNSNSVHRVENTGVDAQYQYLLDPHTVTAQFAYMRQKMDVSANTASDIAAGNLDSPFVAANGSALAPPNYSDTTNVFRAKVSYVYRAKYGGSLAFFNLTGTTDTANQSSGYDPLLGITTDPSATAPSTRVTGNLSGDPATRGLTYELFWTPVQHIRVGAQYTAYDEFNGASNNYDGFGRNASDNNTLFLYVWAAY